MKNRTLGVFVLMAMLAAAGLAQPSRVSGPPANAPIEGVWRADMDGLPAIALLITSESGSLSGAVLFYFHHREAVGKPWTSTPGVPEPLFHPRFDGNALTFEVSHRRAHPPRTLNDPPVSFRLKLIAADKAELVNENERDPNAPVFVLVRSDY